MSDPRPGLSDNIGPGRSSTHTDFQLSDHEHDPEDYDLDAIYEGWGFDDEDYYDE